MTIFSDGALIGKIHGDRDNLLYCVVKPLLPGCFQFVFDGPVSLGDFFRSPTETFQGPGPFGIADA